MTIDLLKRILLLDAATCALFFIVCIFAGGQVTAALGLAPVYVAAAGWICLGAALVLAFAGTRAAPAAALIWLIAFVNLDWMIASIVVFELGSLTVLGKIMVLGQAAGVLGFTIFEAMGARMLSREGRAVAA